MYYLIQNQTVVHKSKNKLRSFIGDYIESEEDWSLGSSYIDGVFGEPVKPKSDQLAELRVKFRADLDANALKTANAIADDGADEAENVAALQAARAALKTQFQADQIAIITGVIL